ncbi:MAG: hypothetical protein U0163_08390 [Gemmatimonadaceae bacterium]
MNLTPSSPRPALLRAWCVLLGVLVPLLACRDGSGRPPAGSFVVTAGDSTYWVTTSSSGIKLRSAPFLLAAVDGRFHEIFISDDDASFYDAVIVGQKIYMRDLVSGDSSVVLDDELISGVATEYQKEHPNEHPLDDDEAENPDADAMASTDTQVIEVLGPYLTYEQHVDLDASWIRGTHSTRRGVIDLRTREAVTLGSLVGERNAAALWTRGVSLFGSARDSISSMSGARAARAKEAIGGFELDSSSFAVIESNGAPAVAFYVPGHGVRAGGLALPLDPIDIPAGTWWSEVKRTLPVADPGGFDVWPGADYDVLARYGPGEQYADLSVRAAGSQREVRVGRVQGPVRRVMRVSREDGETLRALRRAFDDAVLYSGEARTTALVRTRSAVRLHTS